jgi:hypothetical protein
MAKMMQIDPTSDSRHSEKAHTLASEELYLQRKRILGNVGKSNQDQSAKIRQLSTEKQWVKTELFEQSIGKGNDMPARLPRESPLKNFINFAQIEEEVVQARVQYAMAKKELRRERQLLGRASDVTIQRIKEIGKALAVLYERRDATQTDRSRIEAFRRPGGTTKVERSTN